MSCRAHKLRGATARNWRIDRAFRRDQRIFRRDSLTWNRELSSSRKLYLVTKVFSYPRDATARDNKPQERFRAGERRAPNVAGFRTFSTRTEVRANKREKIFFRGEPTNFASWYTSRGIFRPEGSRGKQDSLHLISFYPAQIIDNARTGEYCPFCARSLAKRVNLSPRRIICGGYSATVSANERSAGRERSNTPTGIGK